MRINDTLKTIKKKFVSKNKEKRKFIIAGIFNIFITNLFLQIFLIFNLFNVFLATLISQLINMAMGYFLYSKFIFQVTKVKNLKFILRYLSLMTLIWNINVFGIKLGFYYGISENFSAFFMIPFLALISYIMQKFWVFKEF